ncbi:MAG: FAD-dependent oxidoreductase, partial [Actinomycetota bacterium]
RCIVAAGAWAGPLLEPAGFSLPVSVTREQVFYFRPAIDMVPFIDHGSIARYAVPAFAGAAGVKIAEHMTGERTSAAGRSFELDPEGEARVAAYVEAMLPGLDPEPVAFETCLYTMTPDQDFVIDARGPLIVASACSGHGFKFAPLIGEALARLATGTHPLPFALDRFSPARFNA